jgi:thioredoxin 1
MIIDLPHSEIVAAYDLMKKNDISEMGYSLQSEQSRTLQDLLPTESQDDDSAVKTTEFCATAEKNNVLSDCKQELTLITEANFQREVLESDRPVVLNVFLRGCGPCMASAPIFAEVSGQFGDKIKFIKLDYSKEKSLVKELDVRGVPAYFFFKDGKIVDQFVGQIGSKETFILQIQRALL